MRIQITDTSKKIITVMQSKVAREIVRDFQDDEISVNEYVETAVHLVYGGYDAVEVLKGSAEITRNCRAWNKMNDHSEDLDVWIKGLAFVHGDEFIIIEAYLTDIWEASPQNRAEIVSHFYVRRFKEV